VRQGLVRRLLDRADGVSRKALREAVFYVVGNCRTRAVLKLFLFFSLAANDVCFKNWLCDV